ncbi:MAG TPA: MopE-related protein, partial [Polyangiaceae bacterium]
CDDADPDVFPGAWDGPADGAKPDRCGDGIDQNCSGSDGDDVASDGTTCACTPGDTATCSEDSGGIPIVWPTGTPVGACKYGVKTCVKDPKSGVAAWGACSGAIAPVQEFCNGGVDDNCRGNGDDDATDKIYFLYDGDNDLHAHKGWAPVLSCPEVAPNLVPPECETSDGAAGADGGGETCPPDRWRPNIPANDCDDANADVYPGATEVCDGLDNDCNGVVDDATTAATWYFDGDMDGHVAPTAKTLSQCANPGSVAANCPASAAPCLANWTVHPTSQQDCDDANADRYPGNWDGPAANPFGLLAPGWNFAHFKRTAATIATPPGTNETPSATGAATELDRDWGMFGGDYWSERWTGTLKLTAAGSYTFYATADDGVRLWLDAATTPLIDSWTNTPGTRTASSALTAGNHTVRVEYYDNTGVALLRMEWQGPGITRQVLREVDDATEPSRCDGVDQNCKGGADDDQATSAGAARGCTMQCQPAQVGECEGLNAKGVVNVGACQNGIRSCSASGVWDACTGAIDPSSEICDGADNNCDGQTDEGVLTTFSYDGDSDGWCTTTTQQACNDPDGSGTQWKQSCSGHEAASCDNDAQNSPALTEVCDGKDNNCNGQVDEGFNVGSPCSFGSQLGACANTGTIQCSNGGAICVAPPGIPSTSFMDHAAPNGSYDWNCDGTVSPVYTHPFDGSFNGDCGNNQPLFCNPPKFAVKDSSGPVQWNCGGTLWEYGCIQNGNACQNNPSYTVQVVTQICN